jgi:hypothetical protein
MPKKKPQPEIVVFFRFNNTKKRVFGALSAFHFLEHLEHAFGRIYKEAFECLAQTTTL